MMRKNFVILLILTLSLIFILNGCQRLGTFCPSPGVCVYPEDNISENESFDDITGEIIGDIQDEEDIDEEINETEDTEDVIDEIDEEVEADIVVTEGELVQVSPEASDPEGETIEFTFSEPLNANGEWQTEAGDAGLYTATITASDGVNEVTQEIVILVKSANRPPIMEFIEDKEVTEGDTVSFEPEVVDPEGDEISIIYSGWMTSGEYTTTYEDAGEHTVTITATDGVNEVSQDVIVIVNDLNRPPVMEAIDDISVMEGDPIAVSVDATDPDGDALDIIFSEPLDANGEWLTEVGDAGVYEVEVIVSDGQAEVTQNFTIEVEAVNRPPKIEIEDTIEVDEGETIILNPIVTDPDDDSVDISYSGWMTSGEYTTTYEDAGEHTVTITATDGQAEVSQDITIIVNDVNRPPEFTIPY